MQQSVSPSKAPEGATGVLVSSDGTALWGHGFGACGARVGEVCFNTAMTGYQEILTDPSYAGQIVLFTFPHIGNVGANAEDIETVNPAACGLIVREPVSAPSNYRAGSALENWLETHGLVGLSGVDTRAATARIRRRGFFNAVIAHDPNGNFDIPALAEQAAAWPGLEGMDLAQGVSGAQTSRWEETPWRHGTGYGRQENPKHHVVVIDYGVKRNILRCLSAAGCAVTVVPARASVEDIMAHRPDGVMLSNGPGDPAATGEYAVPVIKSLLDKGVPLFGICLGHQMLALALGAKTVKMPQGHHGANHPVKDLSTGKVEIVSMNHGFTVARESLPAGITETHVSLFDGSNCGLAVTGRPILSVQYHPEASPGPQDSHYLFERFAGLMERGADG